MKTATIEYEGHELGVVYENRQLYAGFISNAGVSKDWVMDYDEDFTFDQNLEALCDLITETWDYESDISNEEQF